jgi:hypothetical protein
MKNNLKNKLESIKFENFKSFTSRTSTSISAELKQINDTSKYAKIAMEICKLLFTNDELNTGYFHDDSDGPLLPNKFNLDNDITFLLKSNLILAKIYFYKSLIKFIQQIQLK